MDRISSLHERCPLFGLRRYTVRVMQRHQNATQSLVKEATQEHDPHQWALG
eukprot:m.990058 g.990058  ORF g.990058 m.990058 type:complete len:51 (-) comp24000_c1_seq7:70-222(-)